MNRLFALAIILCAAPAFADAGGEPINTECNGVGNPNSYCDGSEVIPPDDTEQPPASTAICLVPTEAAKAYLASDFVFNLDREACAKQCKAIAKTCSGVSKAHAKCWGAIIKGNRKFGLPNCATITDKAFRKECTTKVRSFSRRNLATLRRNTMLATSRCQRSVTACEAACQ